MKIFRQRLSQTKEALLGKRSEIPLRVNKVVLIDLDGTLIDKNMASAYCKSL